MVRVLKARFGVRSLVTGAAVCALLGTVSLRAQNAQIFKGVIADSMCATAAGHTPMLRPGETMAECTMECVKKGAKYVLFSSENGMVYQLDDQAKPKAFAARMVAVVGNLDSATAAPTIRVSDIIPGLPPKVLHAKSVYLDCGACAGGLAKAKVAALLQIQDWKRFDVVPDRQKADLIFELSRKRYLADSGKEPTPVDGVNLSVKDPSTREILWSDWMRSGYMLESHAATDLIDDFRLELQAQEGDLGPLLRRDKSRVVKPPAQPGK